MQDPDTRLCRKLPELLILVLTFITLIFLLLWM